MKKIVVGLLISALFEQLHGFPVKSPLDAGEVTIQTGCNFDGKYYKKFEIVKQFECGYSYCSENLQIEMTTEECGRKSVTAPIPIKGCIVNGKFYHPNEEIDSGVDEHADRCYGRQCNSYGEVIYWDNFNCFTTPSYSTIPMATDYSTTTTKSGCSYNGKMYDFGETIDQGYDKDANWCYGTICDDYGSIVNWDNFYCISTPMTTESTVTITDTTMPTQTTETMSSTVETTTLEFTRKEATTGPMGCHVDDEFHYPGQNIDSGNDGDTWCFGRYCDGHGQIVHWDDFKCDINKTGTTEYKVLTSSTLGHI